jgi:hypothetical protein
MNSKIQSRLVELPDGSVHNAADIELIERMRTALKFYADVESYRQPDNFTIRPMMADMGLQARDALR